MPCKVTNLAGQETQSEPIMRTLEINLIFEDQVADTLAETSQIVPYIQEEAPRSSEKSAEHLVEEYSDDDTQVHNLPNPIETSYATFSYVFSRDKRRR